jgi:DNA repair protein RadC
MGKSKKHLEKEMQKWQHPGGKLRELGADKLSDAEILSILVSTGTKNKSAEAIASELIEKYGSFRGLANQPLHKLLDIKGLGDVKVIRVAAAFELARRIASEVLKEIHEA